MGSGESAWVYRAVVADKRGASERSLYLRVLSRDGVTSRILSDKRHISGVLMQRRSLDWGSTPSPTLFTTTTSCSSQLLTSHQRELWRWKEDCIFVDPTLQSRCALKPP